ncbi:hypothetical protein Hypma_000603 [Hypsizygus marmoreus]|uniref:Uncharacterized protein n=1 Tax=Hypsizygus marmoreus TaxID=39966 RepID=A0A369JA86_HYPMA|nr:hypothetical protein Hypma_000603 [Hypsizygus marmoreus]
MRKLYRSFVFSYMHDIAKLEAKSPGSIAKGKRFSTVYKRRSELTAGRLKVLMAQGFNKRVIALADETEVHSDDELAEGVTTDSGEAVYHIKEKEGRSTKVMNFFRMADVRRRRMDQSKRKQYKLPERRREDPVMPQPSALTALPKQVPIDWFDPSYWNNTLTVREHADYIEDGVDVALPLEEFCKTWEDCAKWKNLPKKEFMQTYGNAVLDLYDMPTEQELEQLARWEDGEGEKSSSNSEGGDDNDDGE